MTTHPCPICARPAQPEFRPFCSRRCAQIDLQRWLRGAYVVPAVEDEQAADEFPAPHDPDD
jgi:endogenous inhibitor of DNA gyrase (YacG/DUF329 family)